MKRNTVFTVDRAAFLFGNILPDASPRMKRPVHRIENWIERVNELIDDLEAGEYGSYRRFSLKLGIVCHFVSDFFCLAHNDPYYRRQIAHFMYETKQAKEFFSLRRECDSIDPSSFAPSGINIAHYLSYRHSDFFNQEISFEKELLGSVEVCATICGAMIAEGLLLPSGA